jgi:hypothetical protein
LTKPRLKPVHSEFEEYMAFNVDFGDTKILLFVKNWKELKTYIAYNLGIKHYAKG